MATFTLVDLDQQAAPIELVVGEVDDWIRHHGHRKEATEQLVADGAGRDRATAP